MIRLCFLVFLFVSITVQAKELALKPIPPPASGPKNSKWNQYSQYFKRSQTQERNLGWSYVVSGGIGFVGGFVGKEISKDPLEDGAYTIFQSIGIAAIGYGLYKIYIGSEEQRFFQLLEDSAISVSEKEQIFETYRSRQKELTLRENRIRALTFGLIAGLNLYTASQQGPGVVRDSLYFIGGVNLLASASYAFEF